MKVVLAMRAVRVCARRRRLVLVGVAAIGLTVLLPAGASTRLSYKKLNDFTVGNYPDSVAVGDFNGDGIKDLAVADSGSTLNNVSVLLGTGTGSFGAATNFTAGNYPDSVAIGDFNGDGKQDLATTNNNASGTVSVLLGTGAGSFVKTGTDSPVGSNPWSVAVGDFNGDGRQDLAVANFSSATVSVLLGNGDGTFTVHSTPSAGLSPHSVAVGDFDGNGKQDLAIANDISSGTVSVLLGDGTGTFTPKSAPGTGASPVLVTVGDFNGDGKQDLATANTSSGTVSVLLGNGDGTFVTKTDFTVGSNPWSVAVGDFNGDGKQDLATANTSSGTVSVLLGAGLGSFGAKADFTVGSTPQSVAVGDFNGDGRQDLATANYGGTVSILLNAASADPSSTALSFGSAGSPVPQGTVSAPQTVTVANNGSAPLVVLGFSVSGSNPDDFFTSTDTCGGQIAPDSSCTVQVRFAPQAQGSRSATLTVLSNAPSSTPVSLAGTAGPLPQGPAGTNGTNGATGSRGPQGIPGKIRLVTCKVVTVKVKGRMVKRKKCTTKLVSGTVSFTTASAARASLTRGGVLYATGTVTKKGLVLHALRRVQAGRYTLTLRYRQGHKQVTMRSQIKIG
ncbi:MAG: FG-GAP-like repeat-containing protein [Gaiellaceae bacterium]